MIIVPEAACPGLLSLDDAFAPVEQVFAAMARGEAANFPVVREAIGHADALYGFKGGFDRAGLTLGVKAGGYWPHNLERGLGGNHQSTVFLFDPETGRATALVGGNYLTAARTAASAAVSIKHLARAGREGPRHGRRRPPVRVPDARRPPPAPLREGRRLEPPPGDAAPASPTPPPPRASRSRRSISTASGPRPTSSSPSPRPSPRSCRRRRSAPARISPAWAPTPRASRRSRPSSSPRATALHRRGRPVGLDRRGPARHRRRPDRRDGHHADRRRHQRRPSRPQPRRTRSPSSTAPGSACRISPSPPGWSSLPAPPARRSRSTSDRRNRRSRA